MMSKFLAIYLVLALVAAIVLITKPPSFAKWWIVVVNFALAISALLPVALVKLKFVRNEGDMGFYAVIYFICFFVGLLMFNWRLEKQSTGRRGD